MVAGRRGGGCNDLCSSGETVRTSPQRYSDAHDVRPAAMDARLATSGRAARPRTPVRPDHRGPGRRIACGAHARRDVDRGHQLLSALRTADPTSSVVAFDSRFHGRSMQPASGYTVEQSADDAVAPLDALDIERAIFCGYSLGGVTSVMGAMRHPDRVAGIVPQAAAACCTSLPRDAVLVRSAELLAPLANEGPWGRSFTARFCSAGMRQPHLTQCWPWLLGELRLNSLRELAAVAKAPRSFDVRPQLTARRRIPESFVETSRDRICRPVLQRELAALLGAHTVGLDADHDAPVANSEAFVAATLEAIAHVSAQRPTASPDSTDRLCGGGLSC